MDYIKAKPCLVDGKLYLRACCDGSICNKERVAVCIAGCIPECCNAENIPVVLQPGTVQLPLRDEYDNEVYADQVYPRMVLYCTIATDTLTAVAHNNCDRYPLRRTCHCFPKICCKDGCGEAGEEEAPVAPIQATATTTTGEVMNHA